MVQHGVLTASRRAHEISCVGGFCLVIASDCLRLRKIDWTA